MIGELEIIHGMQSLLVNDTWRGFAVFASRYLIFVFVILIAGLGYLKKDAPLRRSLFDAGWSALAAIVIANTIGQFIGRLRPYEVSSEILQLIPPPLTAHAFPSGHTSVAFACAAAITLGSPGWGLLALMIATAIGLGRIFVGVHFPSDVLAGALLGVACAALVRWMRMRSVRKKAKAQAS